MIVYGRSVYDVDWEKGVVMRNGTEVYSKDFILESGVGDKLVEMAFKNPEKIRDFFGRKKIISKYGCSVKIEDYQWIWMPVKEYKGLKMFKADPFEQVFVYPGNGYFITDTGGGTQFIEDKKGKPIVKIGNAPLTILTDDKYMKNLVNSMKKFDQIYPFCCGNKNIFDVDTGWFFREVMYMRAASPLIVKNNETKILIAEDDGIA